MDLQTIEENVGPFAEKQVASDAYGVSARLQAAMFLLKLHEVKALERIGDHLANGVHVIPHG